MLDTDVEDDKQPSEIKSKIAELVFAHQRTALHNKDASEFEMNEEGDRYLTQKYKSYQPEETVLID